MNFQVYKHCHPYQTQAETWALITVEEGSRPDHPEGLHGLTPRQHSLTMLSSMPYKHFPAPSDPSTRLRPPYCIGSPRHSAPECRIRRGNHLRLDYYMLLPPTYKGLPRTHTQNRHPAENSSRLTIAWAPKRGPAPGKHLRAQPPGSGSGHNSSRYLKKNQNTNFTAPACPTLDQGWPAAQTLSGILIGDVIADIDLAEELILPDRKFSLEHQE